MFNKTKIIITALLCFHLTGLTYASQSVESMQNQVLIEINKYRQQHGLNPLKMDPRITKEAIQHSSDMANHRTPFGHQQFMQRVKHMHAQIKNSNAGAENVAYNYKSAEDVVKNWLRSPGHKRNIDGNYNLTGIGIVRDAQGKLYFTQLFLRTGGSAKYAVRTPFSGWLRKA